LSLKRTFFYSSRIWMTGFLSHPFLFIIYNRPIQCRVTHAVEKASLNTVTKYKDGKISGLSLDSLKWVASHLIWTTAIRFLAGAGIFFVSSPPLPDRLCGPSSLLIDGYQWLLRQG
jgi:hypothetical protein